MKTEFDYLLEFAPSIEKIALSLSELDAAAAKVDSAPTDAQKESGNYRKGHVVWKGLQLTIETAKGQTRSGVDKEGKPWSTRMKDHYGYIKNTESEADGDHVDVFLADDYLDSEIVFCVNQSDPATGKFDEHKFILGQISAEQAKAVYLRNYSSGWKGFMSISAMTLDQFKWWLANADSSVEIVDGMFAAKANLRKASEARLCPDCPHCPECGSTETVRVRNRKFNTQCYACEHFFDDPDYGVKK